MNRDSIKKLAKISAKQNTIDQKTANLVLKSFSRSELSMYLRFLKKEIEENSVRIFSQQTLPEKIKKDFENRFLGKDVFFHIDPEMGDGIRVHINDTIIDLSTKSYLENTIEKLRQ